jgi:hypothetical protein
MAAKEDLLANLLVNLTTTENNNSTTDDNTLIQKMIAPYGQVSTLDSFTISLKSTSIFLWGGTGVIAGWVWSQGQYVGYGINMITQGINDLFTPTDIVTLLNPYPSNFIWGGTGKSANWIWSQGQWH